MKVISFLIVCWTLSSTAQSPQKFNYQGVLRNATGVELVNQSIGLRLSILQGSASGSIVYRETHNTTTSSLGLYSVQVGTGLPINGTFAAIGWEAGNYYLQTELDLQGGSNYSLMGATELISVPYALYAAKSGTAATTTQTIEFPAAENGGLFSCKPCPTQWSSTTTTGYFADCSRFCGSLTEGNNNDWRVPTLNEAIELTRISQSSWGNIWTSSIFDNTRYTTGSNLTTHYNYFEFGSGGWLSAQSNSNLGCRCIR